MALSEFDLIRRFFAEATIRRPDTALGIGDDCALLRCAAGMELAITADTMVAGVHFLPDVDPESLGHKCLAVNLSDLAAMGAEAAWFTLALTLPEADEAWLAAFARGLFSLGHRCGVQLVGGDTTRGPLAITIQAMGQVPEGQALCRSGAQPDDLIFVSGPLGTAGLGLKMRLGTIDHADPAAIAALERPEPRLALGQSLRGLASACIDISDGLAGDLAHVLAASGVGAILHYDHLPLSECVTEYIEETGDFALPLTAGDDYELCFTVPLHRRDEADMVLGKCGLRGAAIGQCETAQGLRINQRGHPLALEAPGYEHFSRA
ncbi:MAG: thiamine-phosphate kinase [Methylococcaceae bacterium]|nr:thiamine-phosphate kinase [Methylococcaceae bacterium]